MLGITKNSSACRKSQNTLPRARVLALLLEQSWKAIPETLPSLSNRMLHADPSIRTLSALLRLSKTSLELLSSKCLHSTHLFLPWNHKAPTVLIMMTLLLYEHSNFKLWMMSEQFTLAGFFHCLKFIIFWFYSLWLTTDLQKRLRQR